MLPRNVLSVLRTVYKKIRNQNILWILSGSTSLVIQGVDVEVSGDIDILTDKRGAQKINELLSEFCVQKLAFSSTDKYRSYFGVYKIGKVKVEVMGNLRYRLKDGSWSKPNQQHKIITKKFQGMSLPLLTLEQELQEYQSLRRENRIVEIKKALGQLG